MITPEQLAKIAHEANRTYCRQIGDPFKKSWTETTAEMRPSTVSGVEYLLANPHAGWKAAHLSWVTQKVIDGWTCGPFHEDNKTHPNLVEYHELSREQQAKDRLFVAIVDALREQVHG